MIVSIDYDNTFTADPAAWIEVIEILRSFGHSVICVTARYPKDEIEIDARMPVPIVFAGDIAKQTAATKAGYSVDVWIDDNPSRITNSFLKPIVRLQRATNGVRYVR